MGKTYNICLDVGGTKVLGAVFDEKEKIVYRLKKKSKEGGDSSKNVEDVIISVVEEMINGSGIKKKDIHAIAAQFRNGELLSDHCRDVNDRSQHWLQRKPRGNKEQNKKIRSPSPRSVCKQRDKQVQQRIRVNRCCQ